MLKPRSGTGRRILISSPYLNVFSSKSTVFLPEDKVVMTCYARIAISLILHDRTAIPAITRSEFP
jgi:hypothetical protein